MAVDPVPANPEPSSSGGGPSYSLGYYAAWLNAVIGVVCGCLAAAYLVAHPSWLTGDVASTAGVVATITVGLAALLPQVTRSPGAREAKYLAASQGMLPDDLARKFPLVATSQQIVSTAPVTDPKVTTMG